MEMTREIFYRRPLTEVQLLEFADEAGSLQGKIDRRKEEIKEYCRDARIELKEWQDRLTEVCGYLRDRRGEMEQVKVREVYDDPEPGKKSIYDAETGEPLETLDMTEEEKNSLFAQGKADPATEPDPEPAAETSPEPGATPETAIEIDDNADEEVILLEEGKFYKYEGKLLIAKKSGEKPCGECIFYDTCCPKVNCVDNETYLIQVGVLEFEAPAPAADSAADPELPLEEASAAEVGTDPETPERICSHCGAVRSGIRVYKMPNGRYYCENCLAEKRRKGLAELNEKWEAFKRAGKDLLLFRVHPMWSNGANPELVEFKFATGKNGAWENPIYFPGGPDDEQTEAGKYREMLLAAGAREG